MRDAATTSNETAAPESRDVVMPFCGHVYDDRTQCTLKKGHNGVHCFYGETQEDENGCHIEIQSWNHRGEIAVPEQVAVFRVDYDNGRQARIETMQAAIEDARGKLTPGTVFEVRAKLYPEDGVSVDFGRRIATKRELAEKWAIAWYLVPPQPEGFEHFETARRPLFAHDVDSGEMIEHAGYLLLARLKA